MTNEQAGRSKSFTGFPLDPKAYANPCGLVALSFFNDTYTITKPAEATPTEINDKDIAWKSDLEKFKIAPNGDQI